MIKKVAIAIFILIIASLSVAGCTSPLNTGSPSSSQTAPTHDAFLEKYVPNYKKSLQENYTVKAWDVTWKNSTTAHLEYALQNKTTNSTLSYTEDIIAFPSTDAATSYLNSQRAGYSLYSTIYTPSGAYQRTAGHVPTVFKQYQKHTGETYLNYTLYDLGQLDNLVTIGTAQLM
ncbi:MAG: hypothetical protein ACXV49_02270 [Halobacteriota archaeon]